MERKDWISLFTVIIALGGLSLGIINTYWENARLYWEYGDYVAKLREPDFFILSTETIVLRGGESSWEENFTVILKIASPHYLRISIPKNGSTFFVNNKIYYMLVQYFPLYVNITQNVEELVEPGLKTIQLSIPIEAVFLIKGEYQARYSTLTIGELHFSINLTDLHTNSVYTIEGRTTIRWLD